MPGGAVCGDTTSPDEFIAARHYRPSGNVQTVWRRRRKASTPAGAPTATIELQRDADEEFDGSLEQLRDEIERLTESNAAAIEFYRTIFGAEVISEATSGDGKTKLAFLKLGNTEV